MNKTLFASAPKHPADTTNDAGGRAYELRPEDALAQLAATGCFGDSYYTTAEQQLDTVLKYARLCDDTFVAKTAVYARQKGYMKDMPAALAAYLSGKKSTLFVPAFRATIDNGKMLRNFMQMIRSGQFGRKSFGSTAKKEIRRLLEGWSDEKLFRQTVGDKPSFQDIIKMIHPKPKTDSRKALYAYLLGKEYTESHLPNLVSWFEKWKKDPAGTMVPNVPFQMLTGAAPSDETWAKIAAKAGWHETRMNLNTYLRHKVYDDKDLVLELANRIKDAEIIRSSRVFPFQLVATWASIDDRVPRAIQLAIGEAADIAFENVPKRAGKMIILVDVSGSMYGAPVTQARSKSTKVTCSMAAANLGAALWKANPDSMLVAYSNRASIVKANPNDSLSTVAKGILECPSAGGGTNTGEALAAALTRMPADTVIILSDNQSWMDSAMGYGYSSLLSYMGTPMRAHQPQATTTMKVWDAHLRQHPGAKLVCYDFTPNTTTQAADTKSVLRVGGFSDSALQIIQSFFDGELGGFAEQVKKISLDTPAKGE